MIKSAWSVCMGSGLAVARRPGMTLVWGALFLLAGCHGGTLDAVYPGELGHTPPPAVNLPPQDAGMGLTVQP
jgi:hypothetical protein